MSNVHIISTIIQIIAPIVGILIAVSFSGIFIPILMNLAEQTENEKPPKGITKNAWDSITHQSKSGGRVLGLLETILFFIAFWISHPELVAGWLVFKVGSKWEIWNNIIKVPEKLGKADDIEYLDARHKWGTKVLMRFLIGTILNILFAMVGTVISYGILQLSYLF
jgi:hypothetical protein